ncbi:unnamed protein product [Ophioblennius macclurei]
MASHRTMRVRFIAFILFFYVSVGQVDANAMRDIFRMKRQVCLDGTYEHEGKTCCLCAAGQFLKEHCNLSQDDGKCDHCEPGSTYNNHPNNLETCQVCTSCTHPNANLEVAERCTIARDTKCRCKQDHYCISNTGICTICQPCTKCSTSIKEACTATSDTVCNEPEGSQTSKIVGLIVAVLVILAGAAVGVVCFLKKRKAAPTSVENPSHGNGPAQEMQLLNEFRNVDIQPLLPEIAEELDWKDVERLAMQVGIKEGAIESSKRDHLGDRQEQTLDLLKKWVESQGRNASQNLVRMLDENGKKAKAEKIQDILRQAANPNE